MILYSSLRLLDSVDFEIRNTIIPELGVRLGVSDLPFLPTQLGFILTLILRTTTADTADQACFVTSQLLSAGKPNYLNLLHLKQSAQ
jgi:hypothetical protein